MLNRCDDDMSRVLRTTCPTSTVHRGGDIKVLRVLRTLNRGPPARRPTRSPAPSLHVAGSAPALRKSAAERRSDSELVVGAVFILR